MRKTSEDYCQGEKTFFFGKVGSMSQRLIVDYVNVWCLTMLWMFGKPMIRYLINMVGVSLSQYEVPFKSIGFLPTSIISHAVCGCHPHCLMWCTQFSSFNSYHFWFCKHWSSKWDPEVAPFLYQMHHVRGLQIQSPTSYMMIFQDWQIPPKMNYHFRHFSTNWVLTSQLKLQTKPTQTSVEDHQVFKLMSQWRIVWVHGKVRYLRGMCYMDIQHWVLLWLSWRAGPRGGGGVGGGAWILEGRCIP